MSTGNPFGLSEISHFGQMRSVGGKAGGFINKKFFHPSSLRNQEKLWKAITADANLKRQQEDAEKRREEERKVEDLRKQMYISGQASSSDALFTSDVRGSDDAAERGTAEQQRAYKETKRRKQMLRQSKLAAAATEDDKEADCILELAAESKEELDTVDEEAAGVSDIQTPDLRQMLKSSYAENVVVRGHSQIWGSWFERQEQRWGFACCQVTDFKVTCPHAPLELEEAEKKTRTRGERRGKKRKGDDGAPETRTAALGHDTNSASTSPATKQDHIEKPVPDIELIPD